jgi:predicted RNA-binding Zn-ribbon protein involved in translation (DUF1610 family)
MPREFDAQDKAKRIAEFINADATLSESFPPGLLRVRKTTGGQTLRVAYSNSPTELKNWSAGVGIFDEVDELEMRAFDSIAAAKQRMGAYRRRLELYIGTPTLPEYGIHRVWKESDQRQFNVPCPLCGETQHLTWEGNIRWDDTQETNEEKAATARFVCAHCGENWDHRLREMANARGRWVATFPDRPIIGFGLNRLLVPSSLPGKMVSDFLNGLESDTAMREHVNQNLGKVFLPTTGQLTSHTIELCIDHGLTWGRPPPGTVMMTAGIDVQGDAAPYDFVWECRAYNADGFATVIAYGIARSIDEVADLFGRVGKPGRARFRVAGGLADATFGQHKATVEELSDLCPAIQPARFEWRMRGFKRGTIEKMKKGKGFNVNEDDALQDNIGRFFDTPDRPARIAIAPCPNRGMEAGWVDQYTKIARVKENTPRGPVWKFKKLRSKDVDFPFAGALAEFARRQRGGSIPGAGTFGSVKEIKRRANAPENTGTKGKARRVIKLANKTKKSRRRY